MINEILAFFAGASVASVCFTSYLQGLREGRKFALDFMKERKAYGLDEKESSG